MIAWIASLNTSRELMFWTLLFGAGSSVLLAVLITNPNWFLMFMALVYITGTVMLSLAWARRGEGWTSFCPLWITCWVSCPLTWYLSTIASSPELRVLGTQETWFCGIGAILFLVLHHLELRQRRTI